MPLAPPPGFLEDPTWADPILRSAYVDLQLRASPDGVVSGFSLRNAGSWWGCSYRHARKLLERLEEMRTIRFPAGEPPNSPYPLALADPWGVSAETPKSGSAPKAKPRKSLRGLSEQERISADQQLRISIDPPSPTPPTPLTTTIDSSLPVGRKESIEGDGKKTAEKNTTHRLMELLVELGCKGQELTGRLYGRQAKVIQRMLEDQKPEVVERALRGMPYLFPYSEGHPWDAFRLEKRWAEALAMGPSRTPREVQQNREQEDREKARAATLERARIELAHREWRGRVEGLVAALDEEEKAPLWRRAKQELQKMPPRMVPADPAAKKDMAVVLALTLWGREHGHPPPR